MTPPAQIWNPKPSFQVPRHKPGGGPVPPKILAVHRKYTWVRYSKGMSRIAGNWLSPTGTECAQAHPLF